MSISETRLNRLLARIDEAGLEDRHKYYHALNREIHELKEAGKPVPRELSLMAEEMLTEMVEARIDNLPV